ncbi:hypothetical protein VZT92_013826 [Zoarces viviparus]|uniref:Uncharacterized protein n=1 Tax=Zoarces viviparus TaxID=48416 RepID=A0AAW1F5W8_ZOAVI
MLACWRRSVDRTDEDKPEGLLSLWSSGRYKWPLTTEAKCSSYRLFYHYMTNDSDCDTRLVSGLLVLEI